MSQYVVLARKYRPNYFSDIVGQPHIVKTLKNALSMNRLGHAFLFSGPRGIGKTTTARILAKALNCEQGPAEEPCNECEHCREITTGTSLDVFEIDGASNNSVDDIRVIREKVQYSPTKCRYKIYIIDEVHMLSNSAFNALLKTLEEPPPHVIFMFATTEVHKIPITIISRCQHYECKLLSVTEIVDSCKTILEKEKIPASSNALRMIARAAEGSLRDAQSLLEQVINVCGDKIEVEDVRFALGSGDPNLLLDLLTATLTGNLSDALMTIDRFASSGYDLYQLSKDVIAAMRNIMIIKLVKTPLEILDLSDSELQEFSKIAKQASLDHVEYSLSTLCEMENAIKWATYPRFLLETVVTKITRYSELVPLTTILDELDKLKNTITDNARTLTNQSGLPPTHSKKNNNNVQTTLKSSSKDDSDINKEEYSETDEADTKSLYHDDGMIPDETANLHSMIDEKKTLSDAQITEPSELPNNTLWVDENPANLDQHTSIEEKKLVIEEPIFDASRLKQSWCETVTSISSTKRSLGTVLENCYFVSCDQNELTIGVHEDDDFSWDMLSDRNNQAMIIMKFADITGFRPKLNLLKQNHFDQGFCVEEDKKKRKEQRFIELKKKALNDPNIKQTIDLFNGDIINIVEEDNDKGDDE